MADRMVRAMTWNIWWRFGPHWPDRRPAIRATLDRFRPDVLALQEVWAGEGATQADELAKDLGMHAVFAARARHGVRRRPHRARRAAGRSGHRPADRPHLLPRRPRGPARPGGGGAPRICGGVAEPGS